MAKILLAEDDESLRLFLSKVLQRAGHQVIDTPDGLSAMAAVEDDEFDLLLADIVMPGMDGIKLARRTTEKVPAMRVLSPSMQGAPALSTIPRSCPSPSISPT